MPRPDRPIEIKDRVTITSVPGVVGTVVGMDEHAEPATVVATIAAFEAQAVQSASAGDSLKVGVVVGPVVDASPDDLSTQIDNLTKSAWIAVDYSVGGADRHDWFLATEVALY